MAWNKPSEDKVKVRGEEGNFHLKGFLAGVIVVVGAAFVTWWLWPTGESAGETPPPQTKQRIKEVKPSAVNTNTAPVVAEKPRKQRKTYVDSKGVLRYEGGMVVRKPPVRTVKVGDHTPSIFKHVAEMQIAGLLEIEPGDMVAGTISYGEEFTKSLQESFKEEIIINPEDDEKTREMKQAVIDVKTDFRKRMSLGEDVGKLMSETREDLQRLGMYRMELENQVRSILNEKLVDDSFTDKDIQDCYGAANQMLEDKGVAKLRMPSTFFMRAMRRAAKENQKEGLK